MLVGIIIGVVGTMVVVTVVVVGVVYFALMASGR